MKHSSPPHWMEQVLLSVLPARDRESVAGDLHEEYREGRRLSMGALRANLWYGRQVLSFVPGHLTDVFEQSSALVLLCGFTALCGLWLGAMGLRLRHPGYRTGEFIAGIIVAQALLTLTSLLLRRIQWVRLAALAGIWGIFWLAVKALIGSLRGAHLEGYVLLIALALIVQAVLTLRDLSRRGGRLQAN